MKFSDYRKQDVYKMLLKAAVAFVILIVALFTVYRIAKPKVDMWLLERKEAKEKREAEEKKEAEEKAERESEEQRMQELAEESDRISDGQEQKDSEYEEESETEEPETEESSIHRYEYVVEDCTWQEAFETCKSKGGCLVNIDDEAEFAYITAEIEKNGMKEILFYLGASQDSEQNYRWRSAEGAFSGGILNGVGHSWHSRYWMQGEPSYYDGEIEENVLAMQFFEKEARWVFNDVPGDIVGNFSYLSGKIGYICEYSE